MSPTFWFLWQLKDIHVISLLPIHFKWPSSILDIFLLIPRAHLPCIVDSVSANILATHGTRVSVGVVLRIFPGITRAQPNMEWLVSCENIPNPLNNAPGFPFSCSGPSWYHQQICRALSRYLWNVSWNWHIEPMHKHSVVSNQSKLAHWRKWFVVWRWLTSLLQTEIISKRLYESALNAWHGEVIKST